MLANRSKAKDVCATPGCGHAREEHFRGGRPSAPASGGCKRRLCSCERFTVPSAAAATPREDGDAGDGPDWPHPFG